MKRLLLILLLTLTIPSIYLTGQEKSKKELANEEKERIKAKKAAIRKLKTLLTMTYRNWYWSGNILKNEIDEAYFINLMSGDYFYFTITLIVEKPQEGLMIGFTFPESYLPDYEGKENGEKTLKIEGRFEGGEKFEATVYSENNTHQWYFRSRELKSVNGETSDIMDNIFAHNKLYIEFRTNLRSRYKGEYKVIGFDISGAKEVYDAAKAILRISAADQELHSDFG